MSVREHVTVYKALRSFVIVASFFLLITTCTVSVTRQSDTPMRHTESFVECRDVEHPLGKTCIPLEPQRIVALESWFLDPLLALGIMETSIVGRDCYPMSWAEQNCYASGLPSGSLKNVETVGSNYAPSIEKLLLLKPDLILGSENIKSIYEQLSNIAPTVAIYWGDTQHSFKNFIRRIAQIMNREEIAEKILLKYQSRIIEVQKKLDDRLKGLEVSVIIYGCAGNNGFSLPHRQAVWFQILDDLGIRIKPIFSMNDSWCSTVDSIENINNYDSDILFIANLHSKSGSSLLKNPLVSSLKSVKNGRAYVIDGQDIWDVYGPFGVGKLLDVISARLLEASQTF